MRGAALQGHCNPRFPQLLTSLLGDISASQVIYFNPPFVHGNNNIVQHPPPPPCPCHLPYPKWGVREACGGKRQWGAGLRENERRLRDAATTHNKKAQGLLEQMRAPCGEAKKRQLIKASLRTAALPPKTF